MNEAKTYIENLIKGIVNRPESVSVEMSKDDMGVLARAWVDKSDMGLVIGRQGVNIGLVKSIINLYGYCHNMRISIKIMEPDEL